MGSYVQFGGRIVVQDRVYILILNALVIVLEDPFYFLLYRKQYALPK